MANQAPVAARSLGGVVVVSMRSGGVTIGVPAIRPAPLVGTIQTAHAISLEATLSFLGVGLPISEPSLGLLISNGFDFMLSGLYWISFFPGVALLVTIVTINLVGDQLRDVLNPRLQK